MRSPLPLLATALLLGATPAAAGSCDHETLAGVAGKAGEVLDRETLPVEATGTVEVVAEQFEVPCGPGEGDEECRGRVEREQAERPREGQTVRVTITSDDKQVEAVLIEDGHKHIRLFDDYEDVAAHMELLLAQDREVSLALAHQVADRATRRAVCTVLEQQPEIRTMGPGLRTTVSPDQSHAKAFAALQQASAPHGVEVVTWTVRDDGALVLELRCPGPVDGAN